MTLVLIAVFVLSLSSMAFMLWKKSSSIAHSSIEHTGTAIPHPHHIRTMLKDGTKEGAHIVMMSTAKGWMFIVKSWKEMLEKRFPKVYDVLYGKPSTDIGQNSSFFLSTISEYKVKMKRLKEKMKKEEKMKKSEEPLP